MKNRFSIGQMSKLHNTPIKTLRYYDEIGLFKPVEVNPENGYRYYSTEQFKQLDIINYLKTLGVPLEEIKKQLTTRDISDFLHTLKKHQEITEQKIKELELIKQRLEGRIEEIESTKDIRLGEPIIQTLKERTVVQLQSQITSFYELELSLRTLKKEHLHLSPIFIGKVGLTLSYEQVQKGNFTEYNSIFLLLEDRQEKEILHETTTIFPKGEYACLSFRGVHQDAPQYYKALLGFLEKVEREPAGDFIQRAIIDEFISSDQHAYLTEIQVLLK